MYVVQLKLSDLARAMSRGPGFLYLAGSPSAGIRCGNEPEEMTGHRHLHITEGLTEPSN